MSKVYETFTQGYTSNMYPTDQKWLTTHACNLRSNIKYIFFVF